MRLAANLSFLFADAPFEARFARAAKAGFSAAEFLFPYSYDPQRLKALLDDNGLKLVQFNLPPGDWDAGERGLAALPGREAEFRAGVAEALRHAEILGAPLLHCMAGLAPDGADRPAMERIYAANLAYACSEAAKAGKSISIEPISQAAMPGYFLSSLDEAERLRQAVGAANLKLQLDAFHAASSGCDPVKEWRRHRNQIGHVQIAGFPGRHEPDTAQMTAFLAALKDDGYGGHVGCEYHPRGLTEAGLRWITPRADTNGSPAR